MKSRRPNSRRALRNWPTRRSSSPCCRPNPGRRSSGPPWRSLSWVEAKTTGRRAAERRNFRTKSTTSVRGLAGVQKSNRSTVKPPEQAPNGSLPEQICESNQSAGMWRSGPAKRARRLVTWTPKIMEQTNRNQPKSSPAISNSPKR